MCLCPQASQCPHQRFLEDYGSERFPDDAAFNKRKLHDLECIGAFLLMSRSVESSVFCFSRCPISIDHDNETFSEHFSVHTPGQRGIKSRAIVQHEGGSSGEGSWTCSKDTSGQCVHIKLARDYLQKLLDVDPLAMDNRIYSDNEAQIGERSTSQYIAGN